MPRPFDVTRPGAVTRLARDVDLVERRLVGVARGVIAFADMRRVAFGALQIPVLVPTGPMQRVAVVDLLVRIKMKPALPALFLLARVPCDRQRLITAAGKLDEILLQRIDAKGVLHLIVGELAVGSVGAHDVFPVALGELRFDAAMGELRVVEIAANRRWIRNLHCELMMRSCPRLELGLVARLARDRADVLRARRPRCLVDGRCRWRRFWRWRR